MKGPLVVVQIVNYNGLTLTDMLEDCLNAVNRQTYKNSIVHIIDNSSSDSSVQWIKERFPNFTVSVAKNRGYVSNNKGISSFREWGADYLLVLNNDVILENDFIEKMVIFSEDRKNIGISSGVMHFKGKSDYINSSGILLNRAAFSANRDYGMPVQRGYSDSTIAGVSGGCMFISSKAVYATGLFDELYGSYYEDTDLCIRLQMQTDLKIAVNTEAHAYHEPSSSWSKFPGKRDFLILRNQYMILLKLFPMNLLAPAKIYLMKTRMFKRNILHLKVFLNLFVILPLILIRRAVHSIKAKHKLDNVLVHSFSPFPAEYAVYEYAEITDTCPVQTKLKERIVFGVNDVIIGKGFSPLSCDYPKGRYINNKATVYIRNTSSPILIHGKGYGQITVNSDRCFEVNGFFDIIAEHITGNTVNIESKDRVKLIEIRVLNEKT